MPTKAIEKLRSEMTQNTANSYIQVVGGFLLQHLESHPEDAEKILVEDKDIGKSLEEMRKAAGKKKRVGSCAVLTDQEGFSVVLQYFNIKEKPGAPVNTTAPAPVSKSTKSTKSTIEFDVRLEEFF